MKENIFNDNAIIICPSDIKRNLLDNGSSSFKVSHNKFLDKKELLEGLKYSYGYEALINLHLTHNMPYMACKELLDNSYFLSNKCQTNKVNKALELINELHDKGLIKDNPYFKHLFKNKTVYVVGYSSLDKEINILLSEVGVTPIYVENNSESYNHDYYSYDLVDNEITALFIKLGELLEKGVSLNNIYLFNTGDEYIQLIKKNADVYQIPFEFKSDNALINSPVYQKFLDIFDASSYDLVDTYNALNTEIETDLFNVKAKIRTIVQKVNSIENLSKEQIKEFLIYLGKITSISGIRYKEAIRMCNSTSKLTDDDYVFMVGFTLKNFPSISKDNDYLTDNEKASLGLNTSSDDNKMSKMQLSNFIRETKNVYISVSRKMGRTELYKSLLVDELKLNKVDGELSNIRYSKFAAEIECAKAKDLYSDYSYDTPYRNAFSNEELGYKSYSNEFKPFEEAKVNGKLKLSYSSMNKYTLCPFSYYLEKIIKAEDFESSFVANLGTFLHKILEDYVTELRTGIIPTPKFSDYNELFDELFKTNKERFYAKCAWHKTGQMFEELNMFEERSEFTNYKTEENITIDLGDNVFLNGKIDKACYTHDNSEVLVVDYKTGDVKFEEEYLDDGLGLQLPVYAKLLKGKYENIKVQGIYINNILFKNDEKNINLALNGITFDGGESLYARIDCQFPDSDNKHPLVKSMKLKKDGDLSSYFKIRNKEAFEKYEQCLDEAILKIKQGIRSGDFQIKEIFKGEDNASCKFCKFRDVCFTKHKNCVHLKKEEKEEEE